MEYKLITATDKTKFERAVNKNNEEGFTPHAHLVVTQVTGEVLGKPKDALQYSILMVRPKIGGGDAKQQ